MLLERSKLDTKLIHYEDKVAKLKTGNTTSGRDGERYLRNKEKLA